MRRMFGRIPLLFACALGLVAASVPADASAVVESAPYFTSHEERVLAVDNFDFDSGWLPAGSPISVRLTAHAGNTVYIEMDGTAHYDWEVEAVSFEGLPEGGLLELDLGLETSAQVMFDILGYTWTGDLMDPILYGVFDELVFDPYLLMNHPGRPAILDTEMPRQDGFQIPLGIDLIVASGSIAVDIGGLIHAELTGEYIDVWDVESPTEVVSVTEYQEWAPMTPSSRGDPLVAMAALGVHLTADITFLLYPQVIVTLLGTDYTLAEIEVPIPLPTVNQDYFMEPVELTFAPPPPPEEGDDDDDDLGPPASQNEDGGRVSVGACDCSTAGDPGTASWLLFLPLGLLRRRR
jgi:uncharacterized protein (TIGR03382 family)